MGRTSRPFPARCRHSRPRFLRASVMLLALVMPVMVPTAAHAQPCRPAQCERPDPPFPRAPSPPPPHNPLGHAPVIVSLGDSYASGEGAPDSGAGLFDGATWQDTECHRSTRAGVSVAADLLRTENRYAEGVQSNNLACSGATIAARITAGYDRSQLDGGLLSRQGSRPSQIDQLNAAYGNRNIDALIISIGGNDVRFADIVQACGSAFWNCADPAGPTQRNLDADLSVLPGLYSELIDAVQGDATGQNRRLIPSITDVFLTEYPDPMLANGGRLCSLAPLGDFLAGLTFWENSWARVQVLDRVNADLRSAVVNANNRAGTHPTWHLLPAPDFSWHGYCAGTNRWINTTSDSLTSQHDVRGTMHPNAAPARPAQGASIAAALRYLIS